MINQLFWDLDNCLVHCDHHQFVNDIDYGFALEDGVYGLKINPCAWNLLNFSRNLVGEESVFMLTSSSNDYANTIDKLAQFKFGYDKILSREKIDNVIWNMDFCPDYKGEYVNPNNVLIDNLYPRENKEKMRFAGISLDNYLKVDDYFGHRIEGFEEKVINFLKEKYITCDPFIKEYPCQFKDARQEQIKNQGPITREDIETLNNSRKYGKKTN